MVQILTNSFIEVTKMVELEQLSFLMTKVKHQQVDSQETSVLRLKQYLKQPRQLPAVAAEPWEE